ncbi:MAG: hypothetical protein ABR511_06055, partial [Acidimicrobiales bacterium]
DLRPASPEPLVAAGAGPGTHLAYDLAGGSGAAHLVIDVLRTERVTVGGQGVDTLVMHVVASLPSGGDTTASLDMTAWFAPSARIWVKEHGALDAAAAGGLLKVHSGYDATLQRLP